MARTLARTSAHAGLSLGGAVRTTFIVLALGLALAACGRRGALEPPPDPSASRPQAQGGVANRTGAVVADDDDDDDNPSSVVSSPVPGGAKKKPKGITIPKRSFFLDPLL